MNCHPSFGCHCSQFCYTIYSGFVHLLWSMSRCQERSTALRTPTTCPTKTSISLHLCLQEPLFLCKFGVEGRWQFTGRGAGNSSKGPAGRKTQCIVVTVQGRHGDEKGDVLWWIEVWRSAGVMEWSSGGGVECWWKGRCRGRDEVGWLVVTRPAYSS